MQNSSPWRFPAFHLGETFPLPDGNCRDLLNQKFMIEFFPIGFVLLMFPDLSAARKYRYMSVCVGRGGVFSSLWHFASDISVFSPFFSTVNPHSHHDRRKKAMEIITSLLRPHLNKRPFLYIDKKDREYQNRHGVFMIFSFRIEGRYSL